MPPPFFQGVATNEDLRMTCSFGFCTPVFYRGARGRTQSSYTAVGPAPVRRRPGALRAAAHDTGFFYVTGHGVDPGLLREVLKSAQQFFALPERDKLAIEMVQSPHFRGYNRVASERTRGQPDWREQIDFGAERPVVPRDAGAPPWARLRGPNQWPMALPELRDVVSQWQAAAMQVLIRILRRLDAAVRDERAGEVRVRGARAAVCR